MDGDLIGLLLKLGIPLILFLSWLYKKNRGSVELRFAVAAIMNDKFSLALTLLVKIAEREVGELKSQSISLEPAKLQARLRRLWLVVEGIGGCLEKTGRPASTDALTSAIRLQIQLVSQRRIAKTASRSAAQTARWRDVTEQHETNMGIIQGEWRKLQKQAHKVRS